jgi:hypothetical protein
MCQRKYRIGLLNVPSGCFRLCATTIVWRRLAVENDWNCSNFSPIYSNISVSLASAAIDPQMTSASKGNIMWRWVILSWFPNWSSKGQFYGLYRLLINKRVKFCCWNLCGGNVLPHIRSRYEQAHNIPTQTSSLFFGDWQIEWYQLIHMRHDKLSSNVREVLWRVFSCLSGDLIF